ncbi:MAG: ACP S-malonyltransferase [Gammaproteobacteria bacterium]|nr:[acyl-carrier-protein] S-malonyltransferase [Gammaproteobacteria bacterium]
MSFAFVFPGQGSQSVGMMRALAAAEPIVEETFAEASEVLGYDLWKLCQEGPEELLGATERTQPAMLTAGVATWRVWRKHGGGLPLAMAGHSLGEYTALVCAGVLDFRTAVELVRFRGEAMQAAVPLGQGAMAAILGLEDAVVEAACHEAAQGEVVQAANYNSPGQIVIAGAAAAVDRAIELLKSKGAKRAIKLPVSVPSHTSLMQPASERLAERLASVELRAGEIGAIYTVDVRKHGSADEIRRALVEQLVKPVRWTQTIQAMIADGARVIVECGPGRVLTGLNRRIEKNKEIEMLAIEDTESLQRALQACRSEA